MPITTFDLHNHLVEKKLKPREWWQAVKAKKIDVVAITEHVEFDPITSFEPLGETRPESIVLVPGMELNTSIGHVIALGESREIFEMDELLEIRIPIERAIEIAKKERVTLSIAHPWGFKYDSAFHFLGDKGVKELVKKNSFLGVEAYNGMVGHVSFLAFESPWVQKPRNFFDYLEKNRIARKIRLSKLGEKLKNAFDKKLKEIEEKSEKAMHLGEQAGFVTAGSDAHFISQIGTGIMKIKTGKKPKNPRQAIQAIKNAKKNIVWIGPYAREKEKNIFKVERIPTTKKMVFEAIKYAAQDFMLRKTRLKGRIEKIKERLRNRRIQKRKSRQTMKNNSTLV